MNKSNEHSKMNNNETLLEFKKLSSEALGDCPKYIDYVISNINTVIESYSANDYDKANAHFSEIIVTLESFTQLITKIKYILKETIKTYHRVERHDEIMQIEQQLVVILQSLVPAKENNDIIMLCDLLEFELTDNLNMWKNFIIPQYLKVT